MGDFIIYSMICVVIMLFPPLGILLFTKRKQHHNSGFTKGVTI